jgi:hypothetical protein
LVNAARSRGRRAWAPPAVALVTIAVSFYTATRARGTSVPLRGLALPLADVA